MGASQSSSSTLSSSPLAFSSLHPPPLTAALAAAQITPNLWIGDRSTAEDPTWLHLHSIDVVVSLEAEPKHNVVPQSVARDLGLAWVGLPVPQEGSPNGTAAFFRACQWVVQFLQGHPDRTLLVFCHEERNRSPALGIYVLEKLEGLGYPQAFQEVQRKVPWIQVPPWYLQGLGAG